MVANAMGAAPRRERPLGVTLLALLYTLSMVLGLLVLFSGLVIAIVVTLLSGLTAYGLWNLRPWGWPVALVASILGTMDAVVLLSHNTLNTNLVVGPLAILYLLRTDIRAAFRGDR
jgi:uncharacterized membrane protein (DUF2068 family)